MRQAGQRRVAQLERKPLLRVLVQVGAEQSFDVAEPAGKSEQVEFRSSRVEASGPAATTTAAAPRETCVARGAVVIQDASQRAAFAAPVEAQRMSAKAQIEIEAARSRADHVR